MMKLRMKALVATILFLTGSLMAMAEDICLQDQDGVVYKLDEKTQTASICYSPDVSGDIDLYEQVPWDGKVYDVTSIGEYAFYNNSKLTSILIPPYVKSIGKKAFNYCTKLTSVSIPEGVTEICKGAFAGCLNLTSIEIPSSVTTIGDDAFRNSGLTSLEIPGNVVSIGEGAFGGCDDLASLKLNDGLKTIGKDAFRDCDMLESITIPSSVESIDGSILSSSSALKSVQVAEGNKVYDSRNNCNAIIETATNTLISGCNATTIPYGIESIGDRALLGCSKITSTEIPSSVTSIGDEAFAYSVSLTSVSIPASVTSISGNPFNDCTNIKTIAVEEGNKAYDVRENCNALIETATNKLISACNTSTIPYGVEAIGDYAFAWLDITEIDIPATVTSIGRAAFEFCSNLTSVKIPAGVLALEDFAFCGCDALKDVYLYGKEKKDCFEFSFSGVADDAVLHVDASLVDQYKTAEYWSDRFASIVALEATGIENVPADGNGAPCHIYSIDGKQQAAMQKGINILRYKNGKTIKVMRK